MTSVLEVKNLSCSFKRRSSSIFLVKGVSFTLFPHKTCAIVGESGSGKTTTALSLLRLMPQFGKFLLDGQVLFQGKNLLAMKEKELRKIRGGKISMIFQDPTSSLNPVFPVAAQVAEAALLHLGCSDDEAEERAIEMLEKVGLGEIHDLFETYPHELSGGMKQRASIAMSLICNPQLLIADEPTTALDLTVQKGVLLLLKQLQQETGMSLLFITHDIGVVAEMADFVAVMYAGEIVEWGTTEEIFEKRRHPYTQALFKAHPSHGERKKALFQIPGTAPAAHMRPRGCPFHPRCPYKMPKCCGGVVPQFSCPNGFVRCWLYERAAQS
jgi:oligopeptide/dipeptide ABC transporter ATP-binding protein